MQLILTKNVAHLGSLGDQVQVKDGYARNYLLPQGMAIVASAKNAKQIAHRTKQLDVLRKEAITLAQVEADKVGALELEIRVKAGRNGRLFGSVTNRQVQAALEEKGYTVDRRSVQLHESIKAVGTYSVTVKLHTDVKTDISVKVRPIDLSEEELLAAGGAPTEEASEGDTAAATEGDATAGDAAEGDTVAAEGDTVAAEGEGETAAAPESAPEEAPESAAPSDAPPEA